jgi:hypothetical protein
LAQQSFLDRIITHHWAGLGTAAWERLQARLPPVKEAFTGLLMLKSKLIEQILQSETAIVKA